MSTPSDKTLRLERTKLTPQPPRGGRNTTLIVAVVAGVAAAILAGVWLRNQQSAPAQVVVAPPQQTAPTTTQVLIAAEDVPAQTPITATMVSQGQVPVANAKPGVFTSSAGVAGAYISMKPLKKGDQIVAGDIMLNQQQFAGLSSMLKPGERAMTIALDPTSSVAGFIKPRDHVDVIGTFSVQQRTITRTVLQNVELLATGTQVEWQKQDPTAQPQNQGMLSSNNNDPNAPQPKPAAPAEIPNATLRVKPIEAEKLILAAQRGKLMLALRSNTDETQSVVPLVDETAVTTIHVPTVGGGVYAPPPPAPPITPMRAISAVAPAQPIAPPPPPPSVTVVRGSTPSTVNVQAQ